MNPMVSIVCTTYNHEKFIANAIDSFLMQVTDFDFEILIGEDCSTDKTRKIVDEYAKLNPNKITLVTSEKNVGAMQNFYRLFQRSKGKYIAICEGDDFWIDPLKLQKQVDYLEENPECTLCFHNGEVVDSLNKKLDRLVVPWLKNNKKYFGDKSKRYTAGELALLGYIPTASFLFPKFLLENPPEWSFRSVVGDNVIKLITASHGYAYYMNEVMSSYRIGVGGSATTSWLKENNTKEKQIRHNQRFIELFDNFNEYSCGKFEVELDHAKRIFEFQNCVIQGEWRNIKSTRYKEVYELLNQTEKIKIFFNCSFPAVYSKLIVMKRFIKKTLIR